jgi:hypothetical protein
MRRRSRLSTWARTPFEKLATEFGLQQAAEEVTSYWEIVVYQNTTSAVRLYWEVRGALMVQLFRLRGGVTPLHRGVDERAADPDNGYDVRDLLSLRVRDQDRLRELHSRLDVDGAEALELYADLLSRYAADVLRGDFSVFAELAGVVADRRRKQVGSK